MDRAERLLTLVAELRWADPAAPLAVRALAARLGVSERTVRRDLAELAAHGLPVRLASGGASLADVPPAVLTPAEGVRSLARPVVETVARSVLEQRVVRIAYADESGGRSVRDVEAHGLVVAPYGQYLVGWCRTREAPRTFRLDRIAAARLETGRAGRRDLEELLAALRVPAPRLPVKAAVLSGPGKAAAVPAPQARAWTLERIRLVRERCGEAVTASVSAGEGAARLRVVLGHLAEWTRAQFAGVQAAAEDALLATPRPAAGRSGSSPKTHNAGRGARSGEPDGVSTKVQVSSPGGGDDTYDLPGGGRGAGRFYGRRPVLPEAFEGPLPYLEREAMIQDAMALRSFGELGRDLDEVLMAAAHWVAECEEDLWRRPLPGPASGRGTAAGRERFLADLLAGWGGPLAHVEWHLDQLDAAALGPLASDDPAVPGGQEDDEGLLVTRCPLRGS